MYNYYPLSHCSKINLYPVELVETDLILVEEQNLGPTSIEMLQNSIDNWSKAVGGENVIRFKIGWVGRRQMVFNNNALMSEFSSLKLLMKKEDSQKFKELMENL
ncbi:hypothetical protein [Bacillus amyloliquefaciens]|uniref:Uncharacterized protein n=1 Tax=Bacillus amyloliquefaciens TaxID=1390 RepID=A0AAP7T9L2_BACAM|nr:hypothetical protein [Bacillus amyloliquefaciens]OIK19464.1 hypothetical protein BKP66_17585 [Bacillus amyloliquefaciens]